MDLQRFRALGAGDHLRVRYEELSNDKNSLSNLDQDLPNIVQDTVPIYSLPQEWLWCGSWCSDETLPFAKSIDLCNNPLTKEHKLAYAKRAIPVCIHFLITQFIFFFIFPFNTDKCRNGANITIEFSNLRIIWILF